MALLNTSNIKKIKIKKKLIPLKWDRQHEDALKKKNIFYLFITLGTCFGLIGLVIGVSLSVVLSENLSHIVGFVEQITSVRLYQQEIYFLAEIPSVIDWRETFKISILTLILSVFSSLVPAYNATKTDPAILMKNVRFK